MTKYIFVCGGVMSGVGKGIATASIGRILKSRGFNVTAVKIDPYVNVDAGTMNPTEHGEVFVLDDGMECDQDMGNYERFLDSGLTRANYMTTGSVYLSVIQRERNLEYKGKQVEVVPHIPLEVINRLESAAKTNHADIVIIEIGGTVGEYQNILFLEAVRMLKIRKSKDILLILVSFVPALGAGGTELKTKPTQYAVRSLNAAGLQPDIILARASVPLDKARKERISLNCNMEVTDIVSAPNVDNIYEIPLNFEKDHLGDSIVGKLGLRSKKQDMRDWKGFVRKARNARKEIHIGIIGKYFGSGDFVLTDSYISVIEAIRHAAFSQNIRPLLHWLDAEEYDPAFSKLAPKNLKKLKQYDGVIVPGGFGMRGIEGKINAIEFCRKHKIPYLGLCYGMQLAIIEFARNVSGMKGAHTTEIDEKTKYPVIHTMPEQLINIREKHMGGSMRLGSYPCELKTGTKAHKAYGAKLIAERHRHRYEVNNDFRETLEQCGMVFSGINPERNLVEIMELSGHPFFMGTQFHPEFKSRPLAPHPLFKAFIKAAQ